jgi:succinate dehydrogenase/fumarate reductase-like Fe-S protein
MKNTKTVKVTVTRFDPQKDTTPYQQSFDVPVVEGTAVLQALDYIYQNLDPTLSYYDHGVCAQGLCKRCTALVNGRPELICQYQVVEDVLVEPLPKFEIVKDLVVDKERRA